MLGDSIAWAVGGWVAYAAVHVAAVRMLRPRRYGAASCWQLALWTPGLALAMRLNGVTGFAWFNGLLVFGSFWALYMVATYILMRSVSVRTLVELARAPGGRLGPADFERLYQTERMFNQRIDSMVANGYLAPDDGRLRLTARGARLASCFTFVRRVLNIQAYG